MAMRIGADLANMREAWWVPIIDVPRPDGTTAAWQVNGERTRPHCVMVNSLGVRFTNGRRTTTRSVRRSTSSTSPASST
jgi:hypothetical protein